MFKKIFLASALVTFGAAHVVASAEHVVNQKGKVFSSKELRIKAGDSVKFNNDDSRVHNVISATNGHRFDLGTIKAGAAKSQTFDKKGKVKVRCAIHPRMKMTVVVE